jgi:NAD(P)H-hydrate epimerase
MLLPDWCEPLLDAETMRAVDRWAIEERGVASLDLMERAGAGVTRAVERLVPDGPVAVLCGKGNNGGDGLVVARLLRATGRPVEVLLSCAPEELRGDARVNLERLPGEAPAWLGERGAEVPAGLAGAAVLVDALLGTGFAGTPTGPVAEAIEAILRTGLPVVSVDVPSGVDASSGRVADPAVEATVTATLHAAKPGLWISPGKAHAGTVQTIPIGIPDGAPTQARVGLIGAGVLEGLPRRGSSSTKFDSGQVVLVGGSRGLTGAPCMTANACIRTGAGYVTACVAASLQELFAARLPLEVMTRGLPDREGSLTAEAIEEALTASERARALALGPGLGRQEGALELARGLARRSELPMVLDADGLNAHAGRLGDLRERRGTAVLTPHAGELGRLMGLASEEIERERLAHVRAAAEQAGAVVVLKGDDTLVADPTGLVAVSPGGSPALATAGTGDVLTGVIAALLAQGVDAFAAAGAGVWLHAEAGRRAAREVGVAEAVIATDVIAQLGRARAAR